MPAQVRPRPSWSRTTIRNIADGASSQNGRQTTVAVSAAAAATRTAACRHLVTETHSTITTAGTTAHTLTAMAKPSAMPASTCPRRVGGRPPLRTVTATSRPRLTRGSRRVVVSVMAAGVHTA